MAAAQQEMTENGFEKKQVAFARQALNKIIKLRAQKDAIQDQINSTLTDLEANAISKKAAKRVLALKEMDTEKLAKEDKSEAICREALGIGVQLTLIEGGKTD